MKQNESFCRILFCFLRYRLKSIVSFTAFFFLFFIISVLYRTDMEAYFYAALLSLIFLLVVAIYDFIKYYKKHLLLRDAINNITVTLERLPESNYLIEQDYQKLLSVLYQERKELISQADNKHTEMIDYYTLWAHQIKTPISAMRLLLQSEDDAPFTAELNQELFKIEQYVEMVLQYLRLESMSSDLVLMEYPLEDLVRQAVKKYSVVFIHKKISLNLKNFSCQVLTDEKWLVFVLEQLLSNALKYTLKGSVSIYMASDERKTLVLEDTGIGIRPEDIPRIFDRGFTGYNGRMDKKSTGIGLYLCREILNKLGHTIRITSMPGYGTKVFIDLSRDAIEIE